jgi:hypothetical protein
VPVLHGTGEQLLGRQQGQHQFALDPFESRRSMVMENRII